MPIGNYHYFFAAARDSLKFLNDPGAPIVFSLQPTNIDPITGLLAPDEWGRGGAGNGLDPVYSRHVAAWQANPDHASGMVDPNGNHLG